MLYLMPAEGVQDIVDQARDIVPPGRSGGFIFSKGSLVDRDFNTFMGRIPVLVRSDILTQGRGRIAWVDLPYSMDNDKAATFVNLVRSQTGGSRYIQGTWTHLRQALTGFGIQLGVTMPNGKLKDALNSFPPATSGYTDAYRLKATEVLQRFTELSHYRIPSFMVSYFAKRYYLSDTIRGQDKIELQLPMHQDSIPRTKIR